MKPVSVLLEHFISGQFFRFLVAGGIAAGVNFCSRIIINRVVGFEAAVVIAYSLGMITAFVLNRILVFRAGKYHWTRQFAIFTLVNLIAVAQTFLISVFLFRYGLPAIEYTWHPEEVAHGIGVLVPVFTSFLGHKFFSFRPAGEKE